MQNDQPNKKIIIDNYDQVSRFLISLICLITLIYFSWWLNINKAGNLILYALLVIGEFFHAFQAVAFGITIYHLERPQFKNIKEFYPVDVYITVCGEPEDIVEKTLKAALKMDYPNFKVFILNDGFVARKENWQQIDKLALSYGVTPITRKIPGGFKAGNVNNAMRNTTAPFIAVFDADHVPERDFLSRTMGYFDDPKMALVQTPQYYENKDDNWLTKSAWEQQELFFGPICIGKNHYNSAFWCGTNAVVRKSALESIGGVPENNIAEDFLASLFLHEKGWKSLYVPEVLAKGMAPHNLRDYVTQQFRWARGSLEIIFKYNPIFRKGLTWKQKLQYLSSASYYLNGVIIIIDALIPILALGFDAVPVRAQTADFIVFFLPFIASTLYLLTTATKNQVTFNALQFSTGSFFIFTLATLSAMFGFKVKFNVTPKSKESGNYLVFALPHILYITVGIWAIATAVLRNGLTAPVVNNASWAIFNMVFFSAFIRVAYPWEKIFSFSKKKVYTKQADFNTDRFVVNYADRDGSIRVKED